MNVFCQKLNAKLMFAFYIRVCTVFLYSILITCNLLSCNAPYFIILPQEILLVKGRSYLLTLNGLIMRQDGKAISMNFIAGTQFSRVDCEW